MVRELTNLGVVRQLGSLSAVFRQLSARLVIFSSMLDLCGLWWQLAFLGNGPDNKKAVIRKATITKATLKKA